MIIDAKLDLAISIDEHILGIEYMLLWASNVLLSSEIFEIPIYLFTSCVVDLIPVDFLHALIRFDEIHAGLIIWNTDIDLVINELSFRATMRPLRIFALISLASSALFINFLLM